ncbi:Uncharacterised protein [Vibrio cholerae]|nr:Uncharacterised protein [Vibrio cholerae]
MKRTVSLSVSRRKPQAHGSKGYSILDLAMSPPILPLV